MALEEFRLSLIEYKENNQRRGNRLLIHPSINSDLLNRIEDDIDLLPPIKSTIDKTNIEFYRIGYKEQIYFKDELLVFIFAFINQDWDVIKGIDIETGKLYFWLKNNDVVYAPSLAVITKEEIFFKRFQQLEEIRNEYVESYLRKNNNLYKFYKTRNFKFKKNKNFSIDFVSRIKNKFDENIEKQYILDDEKKERLKKYFYRDNFIEFRQALTQKRISYLQSDKIALHPSIDDGILEIIESAAKNIYELMKKEYNVHIHYHNNTIGNCHALSIMLNLYNGDFKLIQGRIPYIKRFYYGETEEFYQHSWLEKDDIIYDPALRIITTKDLYYTFALKQDEYSKKDTEKILRKIGFNLTHFRDFLNGVQIGNDETIRYRSLVDKVGCSEFKEQGEKLISFVKTISR